MSQSEVHIKQSEPGDAGYVAYMHGRYYWKHHGFHAGSEYYVIELRRRCDVRKDRNCNVVVGIALSFGTVLPD